jgi:uroporphyrinogen decarboxylase
MTQKDMPTVNITSKPKLTKKDRFLAAIQQKPVDRPPVWLMRQAGRYLPAYQEVKKNHTFLELCRNADLAAEVSIQPYEILGVDAIIVFNDILIPLEQLGQSVDFTDKGPVLVPAFRNNNQIENMRRIPFDETPHVYNSIAEIRHRAGNDVPILGFAGAPFTLATYMIEGITTKSLRYLKERLYSTPDLLIRMLELITATVIDYLRIQIKAGADVVQIFDTWAGELSIDDYQKYALPYQKQIIETIQSEGTPVILYVKGSTPFLTEMKNSNASVLSVDWRMNLQDVDSIVGSNVTLQGNLDPTALYAPPDNVHQKTLDILHSFDRTTGHIFNLGHGVLPETPVESVQAVIETVQNYDYNSLES